ncbi:uncharacterized protein LOC142356248 [Convolutriloba macropyga]|uniref:uncharacterized protein LOC142356248 n=1 Tax=Convolutriloba macropyga TaxID=536237 RepID=UPI003F51FBB2
MDRIGLYEPNFAPYAYMKRLKMPLVYKRLKFFGPQNDPEDFEDKRMYRGIGKREDDSLFVPYEPNLSEYEPAKRLKMPLVYKRLKIFGAQTEPRFL